MMSFRRFYHRRFGYNERFHVAVLITLIVAAYVAVPFVVRFVDAIQGYSPAYYEPKDVAREDWLKRQVGGSALTSISIEVIVDVLLIVFVALVWLTFVPARSPRRRPPAR